MDAGETNCKRTKVFSCMEGKSSMTISSSKRQQRNLFDPASVFSLLMTILSSKIQERDFFDQAQVKFVFTCQTVASSQRQTRIWSLVKEFSILSFVACNGLAICTINASEDFAVVPECFDLHQHPECRHHLGLDDLFGVSMACISIGQ